MLLVFYTKKINMLIFLRELFRSKEIIYKITDKHEETDYENQNSLNCSLNLEISLINY